LNNVAKHAQAQQVQVTLETQAEIVRLTIADGGIGFNPDLPSLQNPADLPDKQPGWGLMTMSERAEAVGGHLQIRSLPGQGTEVVVEVQI
jgi:signal transduction histidine kinase